jgi:hypothetical protein
MAKKQNETYSPQEAKKRLEAALRGARISGHKSMSEIAPKRKDAARPVKGKRAKRP